ncbi:MAG: 4Fe-4S dicluster domain-containing protein [Candidatus Midichloria sp.]|nr:4Fe-4S dicluster domain-containing protein [Candidatus Midichloria sp.]
MVKIYPQSVVGRYRTIKNRVNIVLLLFYFLTPWLRWYRDESAPAQAIMIDLPTRRAYFFNIEIWPEEIFYIMTILIIAAFGLFLFTSILGRIWCGYTYDAPSFCHDLFLGHLGTASRSWLFGLTFTTYILAGFMREKVCTYICPYGRFQSAMLDNDSLIVTYHSWRGEPRLQKNTKLKNFGDCVDCYRCVAVCPMGIDIRDGLQMQCIGCGLCIDACDSVMSKLPISLLA